MNLILRPPTLADEAAFQQVKDTPVLSNQTFLLNYKPGMPFKDFVIICEEHAAGRNLPTGFVPASFYFGFVDGRIVGRLALRWELNDYLQRVAGHVGFVVIPSEQRKGYASEMLLQALVLARQRGLKRVLLTCDDDNEASRKTIESGGGVLEDVYVGTDAPKPKRRYWIAL